MRGDARRDERAAMGSTRKPLLSAEEQAAALLDMASDPNILGRAFLGWRPWL